MKYFNPGAITILLILLANCRIYSEEWPKVMTHSSGVEVTFFQPQIESFDKIMLECRAAIMVQNPKIQDPIWGAVWIKTKVLTDRDTRLISLEDVQVTDTKFPGQDSTRINELKKFLAAELPTWELNITVDDLIASLDSIRITSKDQFKADPPEVIHVEYPAVLITIDGDPVFQKLENTGLEYVVNTPFFITKDPRYDSYYLKGGFLWYKSDNVLEGWEWTKKVPSDLLKFVESKAPDSIKVDPDTIEVKPKILVRTKPAELIETEGKPELAPIEGTSLLYVKNSESDIIVDINSQMHFILISGRWFSAKTLSGSWSFVEPEKLPADFAKIPGDSDMGNVLANVPGTEESKDAILETQIPQTAKVDRNKTIEVKYDGEPKFDNIESSPELEYAVNTDKSVIKFDKTYYCCDNAVWYEATNPKGPWKVSTSIPDEIYEMTPESPVYNVKYVYVYDSTPDVVYVGYYPGYTGCYVYGGTVIYGTGYYYQPWYGAYYYPRPVTYGFSMHYNPYMGWSFGFGINFGGPLWFSVGFTPYAYHHGYWGAGGYHAGYNHGYYHGARAGYYAGYRAGQRDDFNGNRNVYRNERAGVSTNDRQRNNNVSNMDRQRNNPNVSTSDRQRNNTNVSTNDRQRNTSGSKNNVFTDKQGNVYKKDNNEWQKRENNNWSDVNKSKDKSSYDRNKKDLDKSYNNRQKSNQRTQTYNQQRSTQTRSYNRGGGGGGRRR